MSAISARCRNCPVQELIDALPAPEDITADNAPGVEAQFAGIDEAKAALTDKELGELDTARYEAAAVALFALPPAAMFAEEAVETDAEYSIDDGQT